MTEELLEIIDERGTMIGIAPRSEIHGNPKLIHKVVHVLVFSPDGRLLLQKRSMDKDVAPGMWDTSVGGHVEAGETLQSAVSREMQEELGINANTVFIYSYIHSNQFETELVHTYSCTYSGDFQFNKAEIDELRFWSMEKLQDSIDKGILSDNFMHELRTYIKHIQTPRTS